MEVDVIGRYLWVGPAAVVTVFVKNALVLKAFMLSYRGMQRALKKDFTPGIDLESNGHCKGSIIELHFIEDVLYYTNKYSIVYSG